MPPKKKVQKKKKSPELAEYKRYEYTEEFYVDSETEIAKRLRTNEEVLEEFKTERESTINKIKEVCSLAGSDAAKWITIDNLAKRLRDAEQKLLSKLQ